MKKTLEKLNLDTKYVLSKDDLKNIKGGEFDYAGYNYCINYYKERGTYSSAKDDACYTANIC